MLITLPTFFCSTAGRRQQEGHQQGPAQKAGRPTRQSIDRQKPCTDEERGLLSAETPALALIWFSCQVSVPTGWVCCMRMKALQPIDISSQQAIMVAAAVQTALVAAKPVQARQSRGRVVRVAAVQQQGELEQRAQLA